MKPVLQIVARKDEKGMENKMQRKHIWGTVKKKKSLNGQDVLIILGCETMFLKWITDKEE